MKIIVFVEGGLVQTVMTDEEAEVMIIDYDVEGSDPPERLMKLDGDDAYVYRFNTYELNADRVNEIFALNKEKDGAGIPDGQIPEELTTRPVPTLHSTRFCPKCHQAWAIHHDDGSCIVDWEKSNGNS